MNFVFRNLINPKMTFEINNSNVKNPTDELLIYSKYWKIHEINPILFPNFNSSLPMKIIYHFENDQWIPFVLIAESSILNFNKVPRGYGVYPLKKFMKNDFLGTYDGKIIVSAQTWLEVCKKYSYYIKSNPNHDDTYIMFILKKENGHLIPSFVDGSKGTFKSTPFLHLINDFYNTNLTPNLKNNIFGEISFIKNVDPIDLNLDLNLQIDKELCFDYGIDYWNGKHATKLNK